MRFTPITPRQAVAALGACFALLVVASPANARTDLVRPQVTTDTSDAFTRYLANDRAHAYSASHTGIPDSVASILANNDRAHDDQSYSATHIGVPDSVAAILAKNDRTTEPLVVPYLSHGEGVIVGDDGVPQSQPTVIPYLSHGIGVTGTDATAQLRQQPDGFQPQLHTLDSTRVADDGFDWETTGFLTAGIAAAMLLALMSTIALRDRRGLRSA